MLLLSGELTLQTVLHKLNQIYSASKWVHAELVFDETVLTPNQLWPIPMDMVLYTKLVLSIFHSFIIWNILLNSSRVGRRWKFSHRNNGQKNDVLYFPDRLNRWLYAFSTLKEKVSCSSFLTTYVTPLFFPSFTFAVKNVHNSFLSMGFHFN